MKLQIEMTAYLLAWAAILLTCCLGCAQKTTHQTTIPVDKTTANNKDTLLNDTAERTMPTSQPKIIVPKTPDSYQGDPYFYIPNIKYQMRLTTDGSAYSYPLLPEQIQQKLKDIQEPIAEEVEEVYRRKLNILAEVLSDLDMAKYLMYHGGELFKWYDEKYAIEYAQKALDKEPDDYQTIYVWSVCHMALDSEKVEYGFRRLVELNPNSAEVLSELGLHLVLQAENRADYEEAIGFLKRAIALEPIGLYGSVYRTMGKAYAKLGDKEKALAFYKHSQEIYYSERTQKVIESLEKEE